MRVLVTGASGFIGLNVIEALLEQGHAVAGFDLHPPPAGFRAIPFIERDVRDAASIQNAFETYRPEAVVHAAALTPGRASERSRTSDTIQVNVMGTGNVLEAAARAGCARFVFVSSAAVYGANAYGEAPLDEERTLASPVALYALTKFAAERLALRYREIAALDVVAARLGAVFGPWESESGVRDTLSPFWQAARLAREGREAVLPRPSRLDWNYSRDAARALVCLLSTDEDVVNVGPATQFDLGHFCDALTKRYPKFRWRIGAGANIDLHGERDRTPLATARLRATGFAPRFDESAAYEDYLSWLGNS
jgi:nucleoside-diphosphate-sugar epimerase